MCSSTSALDLACQEIEEIAARLARGDCAPVRWRPVPDEMAAGQSGDGGNDDIAARLARVWAMVADADPELAKRLPGYMSVTP